MQIQTIKSTLFHKIIPPQNETGQKHPCLILLHGRGADENDLLGLAQQLDKRLLIISARAPLPFDFGFGYTWFEMMENFQPDISTLKQSLDTLTQFLDDVIHNYPVDPSKIFVLGFSMGTVMGYLLLMTRPEKIHGLIANSGYFSGDIESGLKLKSLMKQSIFIAHGIYDPIIPLQFGKQAKDFFAALDVTLTYKEYPIGHEISEESSRDFSNWLTEQLDR
jgi:phospholipase/carboxylesterase